MIEIVEISDKEEIRKVLCHPVIYECIKSDDNPGPEEFTPPDDATYVSGYVDGEIIGIMVYHQVEEGLKCHINVLPEYRKQYSTKFARMAFDFGEAKNAVIYAEIPECYPNVLSFAKCFGFVETGIIKEKHAKNGVLNNVIKMRLDNVIR